MVNLLDVVEKYWSQERGAWARKGHYPSEVLGCRRQLFWKWIGTAESDPITASGFWRMNMGNSIHEMLQSILEKIAADPEMRDKLAWPGFAVTTEERSGEVFIDGTEYYGGRKLSRPIRYRRDMRFIDDEGKLCGGEIKSTYGRGVRAIKENGLNPEHLAQGALYLVLDRGETSRYYYPVVSRDDGDRGQFLLEMIGTPPNARFELSVCYGTEATQIMARYGFELFTRAIDRLVDLEGYLDRDELPPRDFKVAIKNGEIRSDYQAANVKYKSDWQCMYCPFLTRCWGEVAESYANGNNSEIFAGDAPAELVEGAKVKKAAESEANPVYKSEAEGEEL